MDLNALLNSIAGGDWRMALVGLVLTVLAQRFGVKIPFAPPLAPPPASPSAPAAPAAPTGRPLLDLILPLLRAGAAPPAELAAARRVIDAQLAEHRAALQPEPARPVA